jgi:uncharacterized protein (TIGR02001 family)
MMRKLSLKAALLATAMTGLTATAALADDAATTDEETKLADMFSATFSFYTNYIFRGVTQTQNDPAFQGSFDWSHPNGLYAGVWASNVDFGDVVDDDANIEVDVYFGYNGSVDKLSYGIGGIYYVYPDANEPDFDGDGSPNEYNYWEIKGALGYDFGVASITGSIYWSPDYFGEIGDTIYYNAAVAIPLTFIQADFLDDAPTLDGWVGFQTFLEDWAPFLPLNAHLYENYVDWSVGLTVPVLGFNLGFRYTDTDIDATDQIVPPFGYVVDPDFADEKFIFSISRSI